VLPVHLNQLDQVVNLIRIFVNFLINFLNISFLGTNPEIGDRVIVKNASGSRVGILRFRGETQFASGDWCGVEFEEAGGKNDGSVNGVRLDLLKLLIN